MNKKMKLVFASAMIMTVGVLTSAAMPSTNSSNLTVEASIGAVMKFEKTEIAIGEVPQGIPVDISFELVNDGNGPLIIERAKPSCGCTGVQYPETPVKPGESATITAVYNAKSEGAFTKTITIFSNASEQPQVLKFSGIVK